MIKQVWKFVIEGSGSYPIPVGAEILTLQMQGDNPCIWALVDPKASKEFRSFDVIGTGYDIDDSQVKRKYIGTFQFDNGNLVFHLFERLQP